MIFLISGAVFAFLSVALGAFGAHALRDSFGEYQRGIFQTAVQYQMFHSLALLFVGLAQNYWKQAEFAFSGWAFIFGILVFSGSLYLLAITGNRWLGAVTPLGGLAFLAGWGWLVYQFVRLKGI